MQEDSSLVPPNSFTSTSPVHQKTCLPMTPILNLAFRGSRYKIINAMTGMISMPHYWKQTVPAGRMLLVKHGLFPSAQAHSAEIPDENVSATLQPPNQPGAFAGETESFDRGEYMPTSEEATRLNGLPRRAGATMKSGSSSKACITDGRMRG